LSPPHALFIDRPRFATVLSIFVTVLGEKPSAAGLAVPGMPIGSPGMEGGTPEPYQVVLFGPDGRRTYARFLGGRET
jgi:hypothetical protein